MNIRRKSKKDTHPLWRPDFRDVQTLPDTKFVRTDFLMNFVAIVVTITVIVFFSIREYNLHVAGKAVNNLRQQVDESEADNRAILLNNKQFLQSSSLAREVVAFDAQIASFPELMAIVSESTPEGMIFTSIRLAPSQVKAGADEVVPLELSVTGRILQNQGLTPSQIVARFKDILIERFPERLLESDLRRFSRNNEFGYFDFTLSVKVYAEGSSES